MTQRLRALSLALVPALVAGIGCAPKVDVENPSVFEEDDPRAVGSRTSEPDVIKAAAKPAREFPSVIARADLDRVLEAGPGRYMAQIDIEAVSNQQSGVLRGWEIVRWPYTWIDLRPHDIVLDVNGTLVVRPDDLTQLWDSLKEASRLEVRIERDGEELTHRIDVE